MTATVFGTGTLRAMAVDEWPALPDSVLGLEVHHRDRGFRAELTASPEAFSAVREITVSVPTAYGADQILAEDAQLLVSELLGNVVRASRADEPVPLIVEVFVAERDIEVIVHDAVPEQPQRQAVASDSDIAESGRGLRLLDSLAPGWTVEPSPLGKQVRCRLSAR